MSSPLQVTIVRAGNEVGTYELAEVLRLLGSGTLKPTDLYWHEGMVGWELVSKLDLSEGSRLPAEPEVKRQSDTKHFSSWLKGCGFFLFLFLFLLFGNNSVQLYIRESGVFAHAAALCCGAVSLSFLFISISIFKSKK
jgi:hypothetical protein